jgi:hypothetical protein
MQVKRRKLLKRKEVSIQYYKFKISGEQEHRCINLNSQKNLVAKKGGVYE